jgi:hypothetical protein
MVIFFALTIAVDTGQKPKALQAYEQIACYPDSYPDAQKIFENSLKKKVTF